MAWIARQQAGAVRECHGDLHMASVVLLDGALMPFDCIEFDPALRWIDVMSDVAFLTMDLKAHGRGDLAFRCLDAWLQHSGDYPGLQVWRFYEVYRALVRAMASGPGPPASRPGATTWRARRNWWHNRKAGPA
jgi:aminoglycoside phosphotransferase family enzyme